MKRALITGISGFVGPYLAKKLLSSGWEVYGLLRRTSTPTIPGRVAHLGIAADVRMVDGDLTDLTSLLDTLDVAKPDAIFHLAAQSFVPRSFVNPLETLRVNTLGTANLLEAVRIKNLDCKVVFAGSSEEYGLQFASQAQYEQALQKYGKISPEPVSIPELPINENNLLRPVSPYATSKVHGDFLMQNYHYSYGLKTVVSRGFNHEGAGRGDHFVTATIARQCVQLKQEETNKIVLGNVNAFRDWSHVLDIVEGYAVLEQKAASGDVYVQGSMRIHSVLSYLLLALDEIGYTVESVAAFSGQKRVDNPLQDVPQTRFGASWTGTRLDDALLAGSLEYQLEDKGLTVQTSRGDVRVEFDVARFRPAEVPVLLSDTRKIQALGFKVRKSIRDIVRDQVNYYFDEGRRKNSRS
jgi:GDP-mannose 4,6-dehydratase